MTEHSPKLGASLFPDLVQVELHEVALPVLLHLQRFAVQPELRKGLAPAAGLGTAARGVAPLSA